MKEANLYYAHLEGSNLNGTNLDGVDLRRAWADKATSLNGARLDRASLDQATFDNTNLSVVDWKSVPIFGDELTAQAAKVETGSESHVSNGSETFRRQCGPIGGSQLRSRPTV